MENFDAETRLNRTGARDSKFGKASVGGFGATLPTHRPEHFATYRETTYARHFVEDPRAARAEPPPPEQSDDARFVGGYPACVNAARPDARLHSSSRAFFNKGQMRKDFTDPTVTVDFRGKSGARGVEHEDAGGGGRERKRLHVGRPLRVVEAVREKKINLRASSSRGPGGGERCKVVL